MKTKSMRRVITLFLCFAIISQMSLPMFSVLGATTVAAASITDDFEDATASNALWETAAAVATPSTKNSDYSIVTDTGNSYLMPVSQQWSPYNGYITTIKDSVWNANRLQTFEFKEKMPAMNNNYYIDIASNVFLYQDPVTKENVRLGYTMSNGGLVGIIYNSSGMTVVNGAGYNGSNQGYPISWFDKNNWMTVKATYDYSVQNTVTVSLAFTNGIYVTNSSFSFSATTLASGFKVGFGSHAWNDTSWVTYYDDVKLNFEKSAQDSADEFKTTYSVILTKTADSVIEADRTAIMTALVDYSKQTADVKALLTNEVALLNAEFDKIGRVVADNFVSADYTKALWETVSATPNPASLSTDYTFETSGNSSYLVPAVASGQNLSHITTINDVFWKAKKLQTFETRVNVPSLSITKTYNNAYDDLASNIYLYYDKVTKENIRLKFSLSNSGAVVRLACSPTITETLGAGFGGDKNHYLTGFTIEEWLSVKVSYDYSVANTIGLTLVFTHSDGTSSTCAASFDKVSGFASTFNIGIGSVNSSVKNEWPVYYDDVRVRFEGDTIDYAREFKSTYSQIFDVLPANYNTLDGTILESAIRDFLSRPQVEKDALVEASILTNLTAMVTAKYATEISDFSNTNSVILSTTSSGISDANLADLKAKMDTALAAYNALNYSIQWHFKAEKTKLDTLKKQLDDYVTPRAVNDFSDFTENFENGLLQWRTMLPDDGKTTFEIVPDEANVGNNMLKFTAYQMVLTPKDGLWPTYGRMNTVNFRVKLDDININPFNPLRFIYSYIDSENYDSFVIDRGNGYRFRSSSMKDGIATNSHWGFIENLDFSSWLYVKIKYNGNSANVVITDGTTGSFSASVPCRINGRVAFAALGGDNYLSTTAFYDDLIVNFDQTPGDWDTNDVIEEIVPYYTGNTFLNPGESVLISGENLGSLVKDAYIMPLANNAGLVPNYVKNTTYETKGAYKAVSLPTGETWDITKAIKIKIIQKTNGSIKFIIPEKLADGTTAFPKGVYAVKLISSIKSDYDKILYINAPSIDFLMGDEGKQASPGGWLRIIGNNLVPTVKEKDVASAKNDVKVVFKKLEGGAITVLPVTEIFKDDMYSLKVQIPTDYSGKYEVFVHSGYGDNTAWSEPVVINIEGVRSKWSTTVFNVKTFGAVGDAVANDTPAIIKTLAAAAQNGGGVVYFPYGTYQVINTLVIPENVVIKGDGNTSSQIMWIATKWNYGELPNALISLTKNVEIRDIGLHGTRTKNIFYQNALVYENGYFDRDATGTLNNENFYVTNVIAQFYQRSGFLTSDGNASPARGETSAEVLLKTLAESNRSPMCKVDGDNIQFENFYFDNDFTYGGIGFGGDVAHLRIAKSTMKNSWLPITSMEGIIFEDNNFENSCLNLCGKGLYMARNYLHDVRGNNRELFTSDGAPMLSNGVIQKIENSDGLKYKFTNAMYGANQLYGCNIIVVSGQGMGQVRQIMGNGLAKNEYGIYTGRGSEILLDEPFTIEPNRNSLIYLSYPRNGGFYINNLFVNGSASGTYGTMLDAVFDGNVFSRHAGQYFNAHDSPLWYTSVINQTLKETFYMHSDGNGVYEASGTSHYKLIFSQATFTNSVKGFLFKNNLMEGESYMELSWSITSGNAVNDLTFEKNTVSGPAKYAFDSLDTSEALYDAGDGVLFLNNNFDAAGQKYSGVMLNNLNSSYNINKIGDKRVIIIEPKLTPSTEKGDTNGDGRISLKDGTLILNYIIGKSTLTTSQILRGDMNGDGKLTLKDANAIRRKILGN